MMTEREDMGLSLSLNITERRSTQKNTRTSSSHSSFIGKNCWNLQIPSAVVEQSLETCTERGEPDSERTCSRSISDEEEEEAETARKKLRLSKDQSAVLEESFKDHNTLNPKQKMSLAKRLGLRPRQVEVWFQNRRARTKLKQTEVECEFLKRCCGNLMEENRRLQKELHQLRAIKVAPQMFMQMRPPTTLTMCPSCERVAPPPPLPSLALKPVQSCQIAFGPWSTSAQHPFIGVQLQYPRSNS